MTLLDVITEAVVNNESINSHSDYPVVLNPDDGYLNLKPAIDEPNPALLVLPATGWKLSQTDLELIDSNKKFYEMLQGKLRVSSKLDKKGFVQVLNTLLAEIGKIVGISVQVGFADNKYTRMLIEKFGFLMGKDVSSLVLQGCVSLEMWELVEVLIVNSLVDRVGYSNLVLSLVLKRRSDLLCLCIKHAPDLGSMELLCILKYFLYPPKDAYSTIVEVKKDWERQALSVCEMLSGKALTGQNLRAAKDASVLLMIAYDEFLPSELCLHYLLASSNLDELILSSALSKLNGEEMGSLLDYLLKWLRKFEKFPQAVPCPNASAVLGMKACDWVPTLESVVKFLGLVLDENYLSLMLQPEFHEKLRKISEAVNSLAAEAKFCCSLTYLVENIRNEVKDA